MNIKVPLKLLILVPVLSIVVLAQSTDQTKTTTDGSEVEANPYVKEAKPGLVLHPTVIRVVYKGNLYPVTAAKDQLAEIQFNGNAKKVNRDSSYQMERAPAYLAGFVTFLEQNAETHRTNIETLGSGMFGMGGTIDKHSEYKAMIVSNRDFRNCYLAIIFVDSAYLEGRTDDPSAQIAFQEIGNITKGEMHQVTMRFKYIYTEGRKVIYFPEVFSEGREIRSNLSGQAVKFFGRQSDIRHAKLLQAYLERFKGKDHQAEAYERVSPAMAEGFATDRAAVVDVTCTIDESGRVNQIELPRNTGKLLESCIRITFGEWRFFPKLVKGQAVATLVKISLEIPAMEVSP